ncbi:MAG: hypothetical protein JKX81_11980 [Arenicella sp.]|nr:hypothetical protein [Arenicella sp.]
MNNSDYTLPGIAAIALAILFPMYWIIVIAGGMFDSGINYYQSTIELTFSDLLFAVVGLLTVYVYLCLKRILNDQFGIEGVNLPLNILIVSSAIYFFCLAALDLAMAVFGDGLGLSAHKFVLNANLSIGIGSLFVFGVADILLGVLLLKNPHNQSSILKSLAIVAIIQGVIEITVIFSFALVAIFPVTLVILAVLFMRKPDVLELI